MKNVLLFLFVIVAYCSCDKVVTPGVNTRFGEEFFPIQKGKVIIYKLDSAIYDDFLNQTKYSTNYIKDEMDTTFLDLLNRPCRIVNRYTKAKYEDTFNFSYKYHVLDNNGKIELVDNNLRFVKLVLPITYKGSWRGNDYIVTSGSQDPLYWLQGWDYQYTNLNQKFKGDSLTFDNTIKVLQSNQLIKDTSATSAEYSEFTFAEEIYAKNIGLVKRQATHFKKDPQVSNNRKKGFSVSMQAIAHN